MDELSRLDITKKQLNNVARMLHYRYTSNAFPSINEVEYNEISEKWNDNISQSQIEYIIEQKNMKICVIFNIKDKLDGDLINKLKNKNRTFIIIMPRTASSNTINKERIKVMDYTNVEIFEYDYFMYDRSSYVDFFALTSE